MFSEKTHSQQPIWQIVFAREVIKVTCTHWKALYISDYQLRCGMQKIV